MAKMGIFAQRTISNSRIYPTNIKAIYNDFCNIGFVSMQNDVNSVFTLLESDTTVCRKWPPFPIVINFKLLVAVFVFPIC
jgi:hypothetical protein